jgi:predicted polyphosphate/ATP-dependent NAD kinase
MQHLSRHGGRAVDPPRRPVLCVNPRSGGGRAADASLVERARERGIDVRVLQGHQDLAAVVGEAVAGGADALGVAGGDGSLAAVATAARAHGLPFVCVPGRQPAAPAIYSEALASTITKAWVAVC